MICLLATEVSSKRHIKHIHVGHSGGTFICQFAKANGEIVNSRLNCNLKDDLPWQMNLDVCSVRKTMGVGRYTFTAMERGILTDEFCPELYDYMTFLRQPMDVVTSYIVSAGNISRAIEFLKDGKRVKAFSHFATGLCAPKENKFYYDGINNNCYGYNRMDNVFTRFFAADTDTYFSPLNTINSTHVAQAMDTR